jgi:hypothetical protein
MHISPNTVVTAILIIGLAGCAGRAPQPVALVQPTDPQMDCAAISIEAQANNTKMQALGGEQGNKVAQNVAAGVVGLFIWPVWFAMDFQGAADKEEAAINSRNQYLAVMAQQRHCGAPASPPPIAPAPSVPFRGS